MLEAVTTRRSCPLCRSRRARCVWNEKPYRYVRCSECKLVFSDLQREEYEAERHNVWDEELPSPEALEFYGAARRAVHESFLAVCPPTGGRRLLDVGCGLGFFLERAERAGWDVHGIDTSASWVRLANERLGAERVRCANSDSAFARDEYFDLITAWDVIEHVHDPVAFLHSLRRRLAPDGRIFMRTPNFAYVYPVYSLRRAVLREDIELGATNHVVYFTAQTMRRALARASLRAVRWRVFVPPQVAVTHSKTNRLRNPHHVSVRAKNAWAAVTDALAGVTGGKAVLGSDLDVFVAPR